MNKALSPFSRSFLPAVFLLTATPAAAASQSVWWQSSDPRIVRGEQLHFDHRAAESLEAFENIIAAEPDNYDALWRAARAAVVMGLLAHGTEIENQWFMNAEDFARRATEIEPDGIDGLHWLVASKGLRSVQTNSLDASRLGSEVFELAHRILEMDSLHAGAIHALGVLNYEVQKLSSTERFIATRVMGNRAFRLTSWEDAERYLTRAVELAPDFILYWLDLGKMYLERENMERADEVLQRVLELEPVHPPDAELQKVATRLLARTRQ
jgi:tetratricopeptide (TPR) repeat protein